MGKERRRSGGRRRKPSSFEPERRLLLLGGGAAVVVASGALLYGFYSQRSETEDKPLYQQLQDLDRRARENPRSFEEVAKRTVTLAINAFSGEYGYNAQEFKDRFSLEPMRDFNRVLESRRSCQDEYRPAEGSAYTETRTNQIHVALDMYQYLNPANRSLRLQPAALLFQGAVHELHHSQAPLLKLEPQRRLPISEKGDFAVVTAVKGVNAFSPVPESNYGGRECFRRLGMFMEEAVVEDATLRIMGKYHIQSSDPSVYRVFVDKYRSAVIDRLFLGDHLPLLRLQQQSRRNDFFSEIGRRIDPSNPDFITSGENYMLSILD